MRKIHRYPVSMSRQGCDVLLHEDAEIVFFSSQAGRDHFSLWVVEDTDKPGISRSFLVLPTGEEVPEGWAHLLTTIHDEFYIYHLFEQGAR